jgi:hypothetical protein
VLADGVVVGRIMKAARETGRPPTGYADARGRDGGVQEELADGVKRPQQLQNRTQNCS